MIEDLYAIQFCGPFSISMMWPTVHYAGLHLIYNCSGLSLVCKSVNKLEIILAYITSTFSKLCIECVGWCARFLIENE